MDMMGADGSTALDGSEEATIQETMCDPLIGYVMVRDAKAGCFDLRVERKEES
jgi:Protein of unknown function (DUF1203)